MSEPNKQDTLVGVNACYQDDPMMSAVIVQRYREQCEAAARADERAKVLSMIKRLRAACGDHYDAFAVSVDSFIANLETP